MICNRTSHSVPNAPLPENSVAKSNGKHRLKLEKVEISAELLTVNASLFPSLKALHFERSSLALQATINLVKFVQLEKLAFVFCKGIDDAAVDQIASLLPNLTSLSVKGSSITNDVFQTFNKMSKLRSLDISFTKVSDVGIRQLKNKSIVELKIAGCHSRRGHSLSLPINSPLGKYYRDSIPGITKLGVMKVISHLKSLVKLNVSGCRILSKDTIKYMQKKRPQLQVVTPKAVCFNNDTQVAPIKKQDSSSEPLPPESTQDLQAQNKPTLFAKFKAQQYDFTQHSFVSYLLELAKGNIWTLGRDLGEEIATGSPFISQLEFRNCIMTDVKFFGISEIFQEIVKLSFTQVRIIDFSDLKSFPKLKELHLGRYPYPGLNSDQFVSALTGCPQLEVLDISFTDICESVFLQIIQKCTKLKIFFIQGLSISDRALQHARAHCKDTFFITSHHNPAHEQDNRFPGASHDAPLSNPAPDSFEHEPNGLQIIVESETGQKKLIKDSNVTATLPPLPIFKELQECLPNELQNSSFWV